MSNQNYILDTELAELQIKQKQQEQQQKQQQHLQAVETGSVEEFLERHNLTKKAELLYRNGFCGEEQQVTSLDPNFRDVTYKNGFKGFNVYLGIDLNIYLAREESQEGNVYSYTVVYIKNITDEQYNSLLAIEQTSKFNVVNIFKWLTLVISLVGFALTILSIATDIASGADFIIALIASSLTLLFSGMLAALAGLLFKK